MGLRAEIDAKSDENRLKKRFSELAAVRHCVQRVEDPYNPRGYRELRSQTKMCKPVSRKVAEQGRKCRICHDLFTGCSEIVADHISTL